MMILISSLVGSYTHYDAFIDEILELSCINLIESDDSIWDFGWLIT